MLDSSNSQLGRGETIADTARVLSRFADAIMIRTDHHRKAEELAQYASVPVINGLTDLTHPCQILADMQTVIEHRAKLAGSRWAWLGDGNNVCNSLIEAAALMHFQLTVATPNRFEPDAGMCAMASTCDGIFFTESPVEAIKRAAHASHITVLQSFCDGPEPGSRHPAFRPVRQRLKPFSTATAV